MFKVIRTGLFVTCYSFPQNRQINKRWLTAIKREQHRDGFEMSVGISASVLQETDVETKAPSAICARSTVVRHIGFCPPRPHFHVLTWVRGTTTPEMTPRKKT